MGKWTSIFALAWLAITPLPAPAADQPAAAEPRAERQAAREERRDRIKARAEHVKAELGLTAAQDEQLRAERERYGAALKAVRDEHRARVDAILTPEQRAKLKAMADERRGRFAEVLDSEDEDLTPPPPAKRKR
jgi:Spy/CpxP family protein refolding chaperone